MVVFLHLEQVVNRSTKIENRWNNNIIGKVKKQTATIHREQPYLVMVKPHIESNFLQTENRM